MMRMRGKRLDEELRYIEIERMHDPCPLMVNGAGRLLS